MRLDGVGPTGSTGPRRLSTFAQLLIAFAALVLVMSLVFTGWFYFLQRGSLLAGIDQELSAVAIMARDMLPPGYHDRISGPGSIPDAEYLAIVDRNNRLCEALGLEYIWSLIDIGGKYYFATSTSPDKIAANRRQAAFFEPHSNPEFYDSAFATMKPVYQIIEDKWGRIRVALLPFRDGSGRPYLIGASERLSHVEAMLSTMLRGSAFAGLTLLAIGIVLAYLFSRNIALPLKRLTLVVGGIATGDRGLVAAIEGTSEQAELARGFNTMNRAIVEAWALAEEEGEALKASEDQMRRNLAEKEILLREVHHRVKNNLNVISSLLNLQSAVIQSPEQALSAFRNSRDRIMAMALVHEELYKSQDYARVDMGDYLERLTWQILQSYGPDRNISLRAQAEGIFLSVSASIPCGLILNELVSNAFKYAYPDGGPGEIRILFRKADDRYVELSVSDDGVGIPECQGGEGSGSLGLTLVRLLTEQLEGSLEISSGRGTSFLIRFPNKAESWPS